jgi:hypothetical protein
LVLVEERDVVVAVQQGNDLWCLVVGSLARLGLVRRTDPSYLAGLEVGLRRRRLLAGDAIKDAGILAASGEGDDPHGKGDRQAAARGLPEGHRGIVPHAPAYLNPSRRTRTPVLAMPRDDRGDE